MKLFSALAGFVLLLSLFLSPVFALTSDDMPSASPPKEKEWVVDVASIFWPIVPGTTAADGTFLFKQLKETFSGMFTFGNIAQARYQTELSKKRVVEANKLVENKDYGNAVKSLEMSDDKREAALAAKKKAVEAKEDTTELVSFMVDAFGKEKQVLEYFAVTMPAEQKGAVDEQLKNIDLQISEAK